VPVVDSIAFAQFDVDDQTTSEGFYWPEIPADVVTAALSLAKQLSDPAGLAAYKATLPADAQGNGSVQIRHTSGLLGTGPFQAVAVYEVAPAAGLASPLDFDPNGNQLMLGF
jgi:hypothetical protein